MFRKKTPPDLSRRINALHSERLAATDVFRKSAAVLRETADAYHELADEAYGVANQHSAVAADAKVNAFEATKQADRILELVK